MSADLQNVATGLADAPRARPAAAAFTGLSVLDLLPARLRTPRLRALAAPMATVAVLGALALVIATVGLPMDRTVITLWCLAIVLATGLALPLRTLAVRLLGWIAVYTAFMFYELVRGVADTLGVPTDYTGPMSIDVWLTGVVPTAWLQSVLYADGVRHWYNPSLGLLYMSHFLAAYGVMLWLQVRSPTRFWPFVSAWLLTTYTACLVFLLHPAAPPWLAAREGYMPPVRRTALIGLSDVHLHMAANLIHLGQATFNQVAAFPSLHAAYPALICAFFWRSSRWWVRVFLVAYPVAMGFMLMLTAEHWLIDVIAGWAFAVVSVVAANRAARWIRRRRAGALVGPAPGGPAPGGDVSSVPSPG